MTEYQFGTALNQHQLSWLSCESLVLYGNELPIVAFKEWIEPENWLRIKRWTGSRWQQLGSDLTSDPKQIVSTPVIQLDSSGKPIVAWYEQITEKQFRLKVRRFTGLLTSANLLGIVYSQNVLES